MSYKKHFISLVTALFISILFNSLSFNTLSNPDENLIMTFGLYR
jgi:hypothetical protein